MQDEKALEHWEVPELFKAPRTSEPIEDICEVSQAMILSKMGVESLTASHKVKSLGDKKLLNDEMLPFFKRPFAVSCCKSNFILIRENLVEKINALNGRITTIKQLNVLNLLRIYQANIDCMTAIRADLNKILPESELHAIHAMQQGPLDEIKLFEGIAEKEDADLTETEIL